MIRYSVHPCALIHRDPTHHGFPEDFVNFRVISGAIPWRDLL
jgi:hypothetical protein